MRARLVTLAVFLASVGCGANGDTPGLILFPGMEESVPYDAYDPHPVLGQTLRNPPEGTVPYGASVFPYGTGETEAKRAGEQLENPIPSDRKELARGKVVYERFCAVCHGKSGDGDGPIIGRFPNPPNLKGGHTRAMKDGQLFHVLTRGQGIMVSYAVQVRPEDRWRLVHYIRSLQGTWVDESKANTATATAAATLADTHTTTTATTAGGGHE
jgi:mono/diheme cytochrome c family protein